MVDPFVDCRSLLIFELILTLNQYTITHGSPLRRDLQLSLLSHLFIIDDDGVETLRPDPIPVLKSLIVAAIMDDLPPSEVSKAHKRHISSLIAKTIIFWHSKAIGGRIWVRDNQVLDIAAKHAKRGHPIIYLVLHIIHWQFHKDWYPYEFNKVYTTATGIPSDATGLSIKPPSRSRLVNIQKCEQILRTQYSQAVFGKDKTTKTLPPKRTYRCKRQHISPITAPNPTDTNADAAVITPHSSSPSVPPNMAILTVPLQPAESELIDSDVVVTPPNTTTSVPPVTANFGPLQPVGPIANTPSVKAPCYIWTWTYSPNSDSVSFNQVRSNSISFRRAISSSRSPVQCKDKSTVTPIQCQDKSTVTASHVTPSTLPSSDHHSSPPWGPTNFVWTFNPQNEIATFRRVPKSVPSPQPSLRIPLQPPEAHAEGTDLPNAAPAYKQSLQTPCPNQICYKPSRPPLVALTHQITSLIKYNERPPVTYVHHPQLFHPSSLCRSLSQQQTTLHSKIYVVYNALRSPVM
eukprot:jgi/Psemu1/17162/gm1.17162_g